MKTEFNAGDTVLVPMKNDQEKTEEDGING